MRRGDIAARLRAAGCVWAEDEAAVLLAAAGDVEARLARRCAGEPLETVVGWADFCGVRIACAPGVFVPRRRSELLVRTGTGLVGDGDIVVDLCCGTGAVGAAILARRAVEVHASDVDGAAVACARRNLHRVHLGDLWDGLPPALRGTIAVVVANTPYVPTGEIALLPPEARDHESRTALDGGPDGLDIQRRVVADAVDWLRPGGHLIVEVSSAQSLVAQGFFADAGLVPQEVTDDDLGATVVVGRAVSPAATV